MRQFVFNLTQIANEHTGFQKFISSTIDKHVTQRLYPEDNAMKILTILFAWLFLFSHADATSRIAIINFELNDMTVLANNLSEQKRTASIKPLLERALNETGDFEIIQITPEDQAAANSSFGYLFRFNDLAAKLGADYGADWIIIGQHSKPSFLYSYLITHVINVHNHAKATDFAIELKGNHEKVTQRGVLSLAHKIRTWING